MIPFSFFIYLFIYLSIFYLFIFLVQFGQNSITSTEDKNVLRSQSHYEGDTILNIHLVAKHLKK